jgi:acetyltransferase-like isoleucine patch superfamily enzyme
LWNIISSNNGTIRIHIGSLTQRVLGEKILTLIIHLFKNKIEAISNKHVINHLKRKGILKIGEFTYGSPIIHFWDYETKLTFGKYCSISNGAIFILGGNHRKDWVTTFPFNEFPKDFRSARLIKGHPSTKGDILIGNDVWIGFGSIILSGVEIGDGSIIGAGSVVSKDVEPYSIYVGNPAKKIGQRFEIEKLKEIGLDNWWEFPEEKINNILEKLMREPRK